MFLIVGFFMIILIMFLWKWIHVGRKFASLENFPGPTPIELILRIFKKQKPDELFQDMTNFNRLYGPVVKLWLKPFEPTLFLAHPTYVKEILASNVHLKKSDAYDFMVPLFGDGLVSVEVSKWKKLRKCINPAFQAKILENFIPHIDHHGNIFVNILKLRNDDYIDDIRTYLDRLTLDIICGTQFQETKDSSYVKALSGFFAIYVARVQSILKKIDFIFKLTKSYKRQQEHLEILTGFAKSFMSKRNELIKHGQSQLKIETVLDLLAEKTSLSEQEILGQLTVFIVGGYDTGASTMGFVLYEISRRADIQQKILEESILILGNDKNAIPTFNELQQMQYLECVIKETLRAYTIVPFLDRKIGTDIEIDGVKISKDTNVSIAVYNIHHSEEFYPNPSVFDPDRFLPENLDKILPYTYLPFSLGKRNCIGKHFAMIEMKMVISKLVRHFEFFEADPNFKVKLITEMVMGTTGGLPIKLKERQI